MTKRTPPNFRDPYFGERALNDDLHKWMAFLRANRDDYWLERDRIPRWIRDQFFEALPSLPETDVRMLLRHFLPDGRGPVVSDTRLLHDSLDLLHEKFVDGTASEYERRLLLCGGSHAAAPIPDLSWTIDLVAVKPLAALAAIRSFLTVHFRVLNDQAIDGLYDSMEIIQARLDSSYEAPEPVAVLRSLEPRELELLVAGLWATMNWEVVLTPPSKDGGRDVVATRRTAAERLTVIIECKQWRARVGVKEVRALLGTLSSEDSAKAILVAPAGFTRGRGSAVDFAERNQRVELVSAGGLLKLLGDHFGADWFKRPERLIAYGAKFSEKRPGAI